MKSIEKLLLELKNTSIDFHRLSNLSEQQKSSTSHLQGFLAELKVIYELNRKGWSLVSHRYRTPFGECDLLFLKDQTRLMVEVKSVSKFSENFLQHRLSPIQHRRLLNIFAYLQSTSPNALMAGLAFVKSDGKILWLKLHS